MGPGRTPMMISWRKYVDTYDEDVIRLKVPSTEIRFIIGDYYAAEGGRFVGQM